MQTQPRTQQEHVRGPPPAAFVKDAASGWLKGQQWWSNPDVLPEPAPPHLTASPHRLQCGWNQARVLILLGPAARRCPPPQQRSRHPLSPVTFSPGSVCSKFVTWIHPALLPSCSLAASLPTGERWSSVGVSSFPKPHPDTFDFLLFFF